MPVPGNRQLKNQILQAFKQHKTIISHKIRLKISLGVGLVVIFYGLYQNASQQQLDRQRSRTPSNSSQSWFKFPMNYCGDATAGGANTWYPVYIEYNSSDYQRITRYFCCDAEYNSRIRKIQVASFHNRGKAQQMVATLKANNFSTAHVGPGKVVNTSRSPQRRHSCR